MAKILIVLFFLIPFTALAQFNISGRVLDRDNGRPIANVSVFLNNATQGGTTNADGTYILHHLLPGRYNLIVSIVGFSVFSEAVEIKEADIRLSDIYLVHQTIALKEVKIKSHDDPDRQKYIDMFKDAFLGTSELSKECKLINPELLDFNYDQKKNVLSAKSEDFLIIENRALGYRLKYLLSDFTLDNHDESAKKFFYEGAVLFEEMDGTDLLVEKWKQRRQEVYENSVQHFLRAAVHRRLKQEGFEVWRLLLNPERPPDSTINKQISIFTILKDKRQYRDSLTYWEKKLKLPKLLSRQEPVLMSSEDIVQRTNKPGLYAFGCDNDALGIVYDKSHKLNANALNHLLDPANKTTTVVMFNTPIAYIDNNGVIANAGSLTYTGAWANKQVAELLPVNYEPFPSEQPVDSTLFKKTDSLLSSYITGHPIEKAYLHFDKPYYAAGDTIYFKAYVTDGIHELSDLSRILYVELIDPGKRIDQSIQLRIKNGTAEGDFALPDTLRHGYYRIRAYTGAMAANGDGYFFDQYLAVANAASKDAKSIKRSKDQVGKTPGVKLSAARSGLTKDVQFFPEGGNMIDDVPCKLAFKAVSANGQGITIHGTITNAAGQQVGNFASQHLGMGVVTVTHRAGERYKAKVLFADSTIQSFDLPTADDAGYTFSCDNSDSRNIKVSIHAGSQNHQNNVDIIGQSGGRIYVYNTAKLVNNSYAFSIPKESLPNGILQLTLFSTNGEPMNERLVFIRNPDLLKLKITTDKSVYRPQEKVKINLAALDQFHDTIPGNFSVAVTDETRVPVDEDDESTILSHLLLTSDLRGYIERPNYYFSDKNDQADNDLDILMLTQGYHRFEWKKVLDSTLRPVAVKKETISSLSGEITHLGGKPFANAKVSLLSVSKAFFSLDTVTDQNGHFVFENLPQIDSMRYLIQATEKQIRKNTLIRLDLRHPPKVNNSRNAPDTIAEDWNNIAAYSNFNTRFHQEQLNQGIIKHSKMIKEVDIKEKAEKKYLRHSDNLNGPGLANDVITGDKLPPGCPVFKDCIVGHLHGIQYTDGNFYYGFFPTLVMIDGVEVTGNLMFRNGRIEKKPGPSQEDVLNTLSPSDIQSVEIITDASLAAIYGVRGGGGVILITTKRGDDLLSEVHYTPAFASYAPVGFYKARVFYSPVYSPSKPDTATPDLQTTIYWNPNVNTGSNGASSFEFFNAGTAGRYRVVVEGIDHNGHLGRQVYSYDVK